MGKDDEQRHYLFRRGEDEDQRLRSQGHFLDPITRRLLAAAGLAPGARVLDLGCGSGNTTRLAAELVGSEGKVVGIEQNADTVSRAQAQQDRPENIEFRVGDVQTLDGVEGGFDAVIGRLIYMYLRDPVDALRQATARVRTGGLICLHEPDMSYTWASPTSPLWQQVHGWLQETLDQAGIEPRMGHALYPTFRAAGLRGPEMNLESVVRGGDRSLAHEWANVVIGALPLMEKFGITTRDQLAPETLGDRLFDEVLAHDGIVISGPLIGAWTKKPANWGEEPAVTD